jgi:hypothetical protein
MEQTHHTFPRFLLERFASADRVILHDRALRIAIPTSVTRAARVGGYYTINEEASIDASALAEPLKDLASAPHLRDSIIELRDGRAILKPGAIEAFLSYMEGRAADPIERLTVDGPPPIESSSAQDRFEIASLVALQVVRGESFREHLDEIMRAFAREQILRAPDLTETRWRQQERRSGNPPVANPVQHLLDHLEGLRLAKINKLGEMLPMAFEQLAPRLFGATWQVFRYEQPDVVGSDEGVGLWARPGRDLRREPLAIGTADAVYFPLGARHILQMTRSSLNEGIVDGSPTKLSHSNNAVASAAHRWIFTHPDNAAIRDITIRPRPRMRREEFPLPSLEAGERRRLVRFVQSFE